MILQVLFIQIQSLERAEQQAKDMLKARKIKISDENRVRFEKHSQSLKNLQTKQNQQRLQRSLSLKSKLAHHDEWVAQKEKVHMDTLKKVNKAAELRQIIG